MKVKFADFHCETQWETYRNGKVALQLVATGEDRDTHPGEPIATATVNTDHRLEIDEVIVKDYSDNHGMVVALIATGVVEALFTPVFVGHYGGRCARCRLTPEARNEAFGLKPKG